MYPSSIKCLIKYSCISDPVHVRERTRAKRQNGRAKTRQKQDRNTYRGDTDHEYRLGSHHIQILVRLDNLLDPRRGKYRRSRLFFRQGLPLLDDSFWLLLLCYRSATAILTCCICPRSWDRVDLISPGFYPSIWDLAERFETEESKQRRMTHLNPHLPAESLPPLLLLKNYHTLEQAWHVYRWTELSYSDPHTRPACCRR